MNSSHPNCKGKSHPLTPMPFPILTAVPIQMGMMPIIIKKVNTVPLPPPAMLKW